MTDTFIVADQAAQGTTGFAVADAVDNNAQSTDTGGLQLQSQITGMEKRIQDKDTHIGTIEEENRKLREQMADAQTRIDNISTIEDALEGMQQNQNAGNQDTALGEDELIEKTLAALSAQKREKTAEQNFKDVAGELTKVYGADSVDSKVRQIAESNGLQFDDLIELAKKSPNAVYKMAGLGVATTTASPSRSSHVGFNNEDNSSAKDRALAEFSKLRKENPTEYWKPDVQKEFRKLFN